MQPLLVVLCDMKTGSNDSIEVTVVSGDGVGFVEGLEVIFWFFLQSSPTGGAKVIAETVRLLSDLLSREGFSFGNVIDETEAAPLAAILEVKVSIFFF